MKVLMQSRKNFFDMPGGDTVQLLKTKAELEKMGVEVDISLESEPDLAEYDLVHLSNVTRIQETYIQTLNAVKQNKPIALSTIYWPMEDFEKNGQIGLRRIASSFLNIDQIEKLKAIIRIMVDKKARNRETQNLVKIGYTKMQAEVIKHVDIFMPNSKVEMQKLEEQMNFRAKNVMIVPNAIDLEIAENSWNAPLIDGDMQYQNAVICVGRIETRKNQLALVKALDNSNYKLILVGAVSKNHKKYFQKIMKIVNQNENFYYFPKIENDKLYDLYKMCKVSALPSWLDTPGLVSLEAASMGCDLAISTRGSTEEYFGDKACYCEPDDIDSIRKAVDNAYKRDRDDSLRKHVIDNYTWKKAAEKTLEAYKFIIERGTR